MVAAVAIVAVVAVVAVVVEQQQQQVGVREQPFHECCNAVSQVHVYWETVWQVQTTASLDTFSKL